MKKKKEKLTKNAVNAMDARLQDELQLRKHYTEDKAIIDELSEIPVTLQTYEFLGELFFNCTVRELGQHPPSEEWIKQLKTVRNDVYQLFELARAARALKQKDENISAE